MEFNFVVQPLWDEMKIIISYLKTGKLKIMRWSFKRRTPVADATWSTLPLDQSLINTLIRTKTPCRQISSGRKPFQTNLIETIWIVACRSHFQSE